MSVTSEQVSKINDAEQPQVERWLRWFDKDGEDIRGEFLLKNLSLNQLKAVFKSEPDDPFMYYCYPIITPEQIHFIQKRFDFEFNFEKYEYFVECNLA